MTQIVAGTTKSLLAGSFNYSIDLINLMHPQLQT